MSHQLDNESEEEEAKSKVNGKLQEQPKQQQQDESESIRVRDSEPGSGYNNIQDRREANLKLAAKEAPVSDSSVPEKMGRNVNRANGGALTEEPTSKKRKEAFKGDKAHPEKGLQQQQQQKQQEGGKKSKKGYVFQYGNYHRYYGYRLGKTVDEDPRLKCFHREWFEGKDCLDIGCNEGFVTISIAQKYKCQSILGVDIDHFLIKKATSNLQEAAAASDSLKDGPPENEHPEESSILRTCDNTHERSDDERGGNQPAREWDDAGRSSWSNSDSLLEIVKFRQEQFIEDFPHGDYKKDGTFDTVLCLSVTKWIHLNWGDTGLIRLFAKIYHILRPGGIFILEPQPWKSYLKKYYVSEVTKRCFQNIQLTPAHFKEVLLDKIGFKSVEEVSQAVPNSSLGFGRSLFLYVK